MTGERGARPLVSVCIPTRDRLSFLRKSLEGALTQTYAPYEIVISDNYSTDGTREFCLDLAARDHRVRYIQPAQPVGQFANHNRAFSEARGEFVSFFHDDDLYRPEALERFVAFLQAHPRVGVVSCDWDRIDEDDRPLQPQIHRVPSISSGVDYIGRTVRSGRSAVALPGSMSRRLALPDPPFDETGPLGFNDHVTWFRVAERWDIGHIPERLWAYRQHSGAGSHRTISGLTDDYGRLFLAYVDEYTRRHPGDADRAAQWRRAIRRYQFWALIYELAMHSAPSEATAGHSARRQAARYQVSRAEAAEAVRKLRSLASGPLEHAILGIVRLARSRGGGIPFFLMERNADLARRVLRMD